MAINRGAIARELFPGLNALAGFEYDQYLDQHKFAFELYDTEKAYEVDVIKAGLGAGAIKSEGQSVQYDNAAREAWTARYDVVTVALAFAITEEAIEDNLYVREASDLARELGRAMAHTKQILTHSVFNNAFTAQSYSPDGVALIATNHPLASGATFANRPTTGTDLSETSLENALISIAQYTDDRGKLIAAKPVSLHVPVQLTYVAERITQSQLRPSTSDNDINAMHSLGSLPKGYFVHNYFTAARSWFVRTNYPHGTKFFTRLGLTQATEPEFDTGNIRHKARERYAYGYTNWRQWFGNPGT